LWDESIYGMKTYVASYRFVLHKEAIIKQLLICEVLAQQEEVLEVVSDDFQAGWSARGA
jgi:hypothetical protein